MALTKVLTGGIADDAIGNTKLALDEDYAFTGTISGAGLASPFPTGTAVTSEGGAVTTNIAQGLAKAWVNFNGNGTIAARDSLNVSGLTDRAAGKYTITFSAAMADTNYNCPIGATEGGVNSFNRAGGASSDATTFSYLNTWAVDGTGTPVVADTGFVSTTFHGDLA
jgi:hypothetical protein